MLQLTKRTEYGLIALVHLADRMGCFVPVREICEHYLVPRRLVAEVLKDLNRAQLLDSQRGANGGYALARTPDSITLGEVVAALEGEPSFTSCAASGPSSSGPCEVEPTCPIRSPIHHLREGLWDLMQRTTLRSLMPSSATPVAAP